MGVEQWLIPTLAQALLFILLAGMSASVDTAILRDRFRRWSGIAIGLLCQFTLLPALGFVSAKAFGLDPVFGIALLAVTSSPGGAYSNWWCSLFNADLALSVAMTTCSTMVSIFFTPLNLFVWTYCTYGEFPQLVWWKMFLSIGVALFAIPTGIVLGFTYPRHRRRFNLVGNIAGLCLIVTSLFVSSRDDPIWDKGPEFYTGVSAPCISGLVMSFAIGHLSPCISGPEAVAVTVETSYQNTGLALTIALATFSEEDRGQAAGVPLFYGVVQAVCLPLFLLIAWQSGLTYAPRNARLWHVILGDYQPRAGPQVVPESPSMLAQEDGCGTCLEQMTSISPSSQCAGAAALEKVVLDKEAMPIQEPVEPIATCSSGEIPSHVEIPSQRSPAVSSSHPVDG